MHKYKLHFNLFYSSSIIPSCLTFNLKFIKIRFSPPDAEKGSRLFFFFFTSVPSHLPLFSPLCLPSVPTLSPLSRLCLAYFESNGHMLGNGKEGHGVGVITAVAMVTGTVTSTFLQENKASRELFFLHFETLQEWKDTNVKPSESKREKKRDSLSSPNS